jgi:hypothetical protein
LDGRSARYKASICTQTQKNAHITQTLNIHALSGIQTHGSGVRTNEDSLCGSVDILFFPCGSTAQFWALAVSMKLAVSFRLLDLGQSAVLFGRVISSSQGLCSVPLLIVMMEKLVE